MTAICLVDTSVFVEILNVPNKASQHAAVMASFREKVSAETIFLPMATIVEAGNHIGQNGDGRQRRDCAEKFVKIVQAAMEGNSPFKPISFLKPDELKLWLSEFPDHAMRGSGLGDLSIIHDWKRLCAQNPTRKVYIWSLDHDIIAYCQHASP